ncbi:MAG: alpha/beta fold hydrolase [Chloroflexi bacterium]|nr:alpha/beta fold hydrolase [Chloroflexota bacterium]
MKRVAAFLLIVIVLIFYRPATSTALPPPQGGTITPPPDPYTGLGIDDLTARFYGRGELIIDQILDTSLGFTRYLISYPSDDLTIYGFMNVPPGDGPFPVIIALHGYIDPAVYDTLDYTTHYADDFTRAGYLVLHPNLRGYWPSDGGPNLFRVGMAVDVLNLIGIVQQTGGLPGALQQADPHSIGLWGHSMGGGISLRVLTVSPDVKAAVLYGAMSGDERQNFAKIQEWSGGTRGLDEVAVPDSALLRISPIYFLDQIQAAVSIHHGESDELVPLQWSVDLCAQLTLLNQPVGCFTYSGQPHTFYGEGDQLFIERTVAFFDTHLKEKSDQ